MCTGASNNHSNYIIVVQNKLNNLKLTLGPNNLLQMCTSASCNQSHYVNVVQNKLNNLKLMLQGMCAVVQYLDVLIGKVLVLKFEKIYLFS
jgi:hypothetical protein